MYVSQLAALRFTLAALLVPAVSVGIVSAQSAGTSDDQWRPAGVVRPAIVQPATASASTPSDPAWRLPNGQKSADSGAATDDPSNPLRQNEQRKQKPAPIAAEPRNFQAPANAKKLATNQSAAASSSKPNTQQQRNASAANAKPPVAQPRGVTQAYAQAPQQPANRMATPQSPAYQRPPQQNMQRPNVPTPNGSLWDSITVAFQGDATPKHTTESLPMPGEKSVTLPDPVMKHFDGPGAFIGPYQPPCGCQGQCCDGSCNGSYGGNCPCGEGCPGPQCGCGSQCGGPGDDPGCGCEPSCGEPSCGCDKKEFCLGPGDDESCHVVRIRWPKWQEVEAFAGVQGFKNPYDRFRDTGNFGFDEGFNIGAKVPYCALGYQFGYRVTQNELSGDVNTADSQAYAQQFVTAGLFHRQCEGVNFGVVWDVLSDERYTTEHYNQVRTELSIRDGGCHEIGAAITIGLNDHAFLDNDVVTTFEASDQYLLFYRYHGACGGEGRFFAGCNNNSDGLVGADTDIPVGECFSLRSGFEYLIPSSSSDGSIGSQHEAWNISLGIVWHWDGQAHRCFDNAYRPMFSVADNGSLIVDQQ